MASSHKQIDKESCEKHQHGLRPPYSLDVFQYKDAYLRILRPPYKPGCVPIQGRVGKHVQYGKIGNEGALQVCKNEQDGK